MESLSLEETNKIRLANGLKPLADPTSASASTEPTQEELAEANYEDYQAAAKASREQAANKARIEKLANQRALTAKRAGKSLGTADEADGSAKSWAKSFKATTKKRAAEIAAARRLQEQDEADQVASYTERDLKGLRVGHDADAFEEGGEHVLTLRDARIEDDEDDELVNVNLAEYERTKERVELLKHGKSKRQYTGYEDDDPMKPQGVLSKYDEEDAASGFLLGDEQAMETDAISRVNEAAPKTIDRALLSLDYAKNFDVSDYKQEGDAGFKRPKKSKKKQRPATRTAIEDNDSMPLDQPMPTSREVLEEQAMRDDDELQISLARARREKARSRRRDRPTYDEELKVKDEEADLPGAPAPAAGLVLDDTTEFIRNIKSESSLVAVTRPERLSRISPPPAAVSANDTHMETDQEPYIGYGEADALLQPKEEDEYANGPIDEDVLENEKLVGSSLTATLSLLNQQGLLKKMTPEEIERDRQSREHAKWIASRRNDQREREAARLASKAAGDAKSQAEREIDNRQRDLEYNRRQMEAMANYKPDVKLTYTDEFGRNMSTKEAWKALNHAFHGHGSGSAKTEARLRKIAEERRREAMASGDTPLNLNSSFQARQERTGSATMVLSVGNRGTAPMLEGADAPSLHANPAGVTASNRSKGNARQEVNLTPMLAGFTPTQVHHERPVSQVVMTPLQGALVAEPAPRQHAGFARVTAKTEGSPITRGESPTPQSIPAVAGIKIAIGGKRKAEGEAEGSPQSKRRS